MPNAPLRAGILGTGTIATSSTGYLVGLMHLKDEVLTVAAADPVVERARSVAAQYDIPEVYASLEEMLDRSDLDLVINLTPIPIHGSTSRKILEAGKHMVIEKPIATTMADANELVELARSKGLTYVVAPPNMLQANRAEAKRLVAAGSIGQPCFARVRSSHGGPAAGNWPLDPTWFYQTGSGPLFDMGVYGIHDITGILGPAKRVVAFSGITEKVRTVRGGPFVGKKIEVTEDDNTLLMLDFGNSAFAVVDGTFNVNAARGPQVEIFGRAGTINLGNSWQDPAVPALEIFKLDVAPGVDGWVTPRGRGFEGADRSKYQRAILVKHLVECVAEKKHPILSAEHARHALEIMLKAIESARTGQAIDLETTF
ncbi:MAG TPA: Gfo/Idh/MocA family oxidoreductase [Chloroflexota bacterium]|nr:Gfo/Idh/MocA family oxidoreductase [Chloroflexota bacterium]